MSLYGMIGIELMGFFIWSLVIFCKEYLFYNQVISTIVSYRTSRANPAATQTWNVYIAIRLLFLSSDETVVSILEHPESDKTVPSSIMQLVSSLWLKLKIRRS